ncbi:MAG TPA: hypothetical protein DHW82_03075 [Spirochaetia bacterium]|nr:hypothetical protein [Spirochaetia bacterium]
MKRWIILLCLLTFIPVFLLSARPLNDAEKSLTGFWEGESMGNFLKEFGFELPAQFFFYRSGKYLWEFTLDGKKKGSKGTWEVEESLNGIHKITFHQEEVKDPASAKRFAYVTEINGKKAEMELVGIFEIKDELLSIIFYSRDFDERPEKLDKNKCQIYRLKK